MRKFILTALLLLPSFCYSASLQFADNFESGKPSSAWNANSCSVVTRAPDGGAPHGNYMLQCNWDGTVPWYDPRALRSAVLNKWNYTNEFFLRFWVRYDRDVDHTAGAKLLRLGFGGPDETFWGCQMEMGDKATMLMAWYGIATYWGGVSPPGYCGDHQWHKYETYVKNDTNGSNGIVRVWMDGKVMKEWVNIKSHTPGAYRYPFNLMSNWSSNSGWGHDANNHVLWDDIQIFSDVGSGAAGNMYDATIRVAGTASQPQPQNLQIQQ